ncbi:MAG: peptide-methionine (R)-S-oxide reductase MsrB [Nitratireductor sp.]|nr:peptide-methionine (R)-S-oxide reductase MsrB [Nitratireductor sp.]MCB1421473.1 peptide-methionine (R)-S-oxide reductase MsrB [Nitratireductor sp.]
MKRRDFITSALAGSVSLGTLGWLLSGNRTPAKAAGGGFEVTRTEAEWREILTEMQYAVLREEATERAFTSPLNDEKRTGTFHCAGCDLPLYASETKFDSGTGWPSFYEPLPNAVETSTDYKLIYPRTEVHCRRCGGHLGHVFNDGPAPTGKRYCMNGVAMTFKPKTESAS